MAFAHRECLFRLPRPLEAERLIAGTRPEETDLVSVPIGLRRHRGRNGTLQTAHPPKGLLKPFSLGRQSSVIAEVLKLAPTTLSKVRTGRRNSIRGFLDYLLRQTSVKVSELRR
jgi:hypothetical protein